MHYTARDLKRFWMRSKLMLGASASQESSLEQKMAGMSLSSSITLCHEFKRWLRREAQVSIKQMFETCIPSVRMIDIAGYASVKERLREVAIWPLLRRDYYQKLGLSLPSGVLLYGPSGCGKTRFVHAIASECPIRFLSIKG